MTGEHTDSLAGGTGMEYLILGIRRGWRVGSKVSAVLVKQPALFRKPDRAGKKPKDRNPRRVPALQCCAATALKAVYLTTGAIASVRDRGHRTGRSARYHLYSSLIHVIHFEPCLIRGEFHRKLRSPHLGKAFADFRSGECSFIATPDAD
jgi:hypothetical protein